jgi:hypothetical protein
VCATAGSVSTRVARIEHRLGARADVELLVRLAYADGSEVTDVLVNVSLSGAFINVAGNFVLDQILSLHFAPNSALHDPNPPLVGAVARLDPSGVGIERPEFGPRWVRTSIQMILGRKSGAGQ